MNECPESSITVCFDMMENLALKSPIGQTYYSRQLYKYVFGVVVHHGKDSHQSKEDVFIFTWCEHENRKDSNMIASALNFCFRDRIRGRLLDATNLRPFCDSCYGQNKNLNMLAMLYTLRRTAYTFPVRGHSFLRADRVFGRIEQDLRNKDTILLPDEYNAVLQRHGTLLVYDHDWQEYDYKTATSAITKTTRTFKVRRRSDGDGIKMKTAYNGEFCTHEVLKCGRSWTSFSPALLLLTSTVKPAKMKDFLALANAIGARPAVRVYYEEVLASSVGAAESSEED